MDAENTSTALKNSESELNGVHSNVDRLPDDLLIFHLSLLTLKEAAATSILSHRWRYLWMYTTGCWSFDFTEEIEDMVDRLGFNLAIRVIPEHSFLRMCLVTNIVALHRGPYLDEFRIVAYLDPAIADKIDQLLHFACQKGVQKVELDFKNCFIFRPLKRYRFPNLKVFNILLAAGENELFRWRHHPRGVKLGVHPLWGFCCLRSLCLRTQNRCSFPKRSLWPFGSNEGSFVFESAKHLICLTQLETLTFNVAFDVNLRISSFPTVFPEMINLKHLELKVIPSGSQRLLPYTTFMKACPLLFTFRMKYSIERPFAVRQSLIGIRPYGTRGSEATTYAHQHLEVVELIGFHGGDNELNLATHLVQMTVNLKRMVFQFNSQALRINPVSRKHVARFGRNFTSNC